MMLFLATLIGFTLAMALMAVGMLLHRKALEGGCANCDCGTRK